jgi:hypothetical protein
LIPSCSNNLRHKTRQTRQVHIDGKQWTYRASWNWVSIRDPDGKTTVARASDIHPDDYPTPQLVKNYIWKKLKPEKMLDVPRDTEHAKEMVINLFTGAEKEHSSFLDEHGRRKWLKL